MADQQRQGEQVIFIAPPTGGLNTFDNPLALSPNFASEYVNFMPPTGSGIVARPAIEEILLLDGYGLSLMSYTSSATYTPFSTGYFDIAETYPEISNLMIKMRLADGSDVLYEATPQASPPTYKFVDTIENNTNTNDYILFLDALYISDGGNARPYIYVKGRKLARMRWFAPVAKPDEASDAGRWFIGEQITGIENLVIYKNRMMASQRGTLNIFYIPAIDANPLDPNHWDPTDIGKAFIVENTGVFTLLGVVSKGGSVLKMFTVASGKQGELSDLFCVLTTKGELVVYQGTDPSNTNTWSLMGHYYMAVPLNKNCVCNVEGDVIIATLNGFVSVKAILAGGQSQGPLAEALERRISTIFSQYQFKVPEFLKFIFLQFHNKRKLLVFNVPERAGIPLSDVDSGYTFDNNTWLMFSNYLANPELNNQVIGTLKGYIWSFCRNFTLTYFLNNSSQSRIELAVTTGNLVGGGSPYVVSCNTTIKFGIYTQNPDTGVVSYLSAFKREPVYRCPNIALPAESMAAETLIYPEWNPDFIQEPVEAGGQSVTPIVCRIPPPRPGDKTYEWQVTDVNATSSSFLVGAGTFTNLLAVTLLATVDMFQYTSFSVGFDSSLWFDRYTPIPSFLDLRKGADLTGSEFNVTDLPIDNSQLDELFPVTGTLDVYITSNRVAQAPGVAMLSIFIQGPGQLEFKGYPGNFDRLGFYLKIKDYPENPWRDSIAPLSQKFKGTETVTDIKYRETGYGGGAYNYSVKWLLDHILIKSDKLQNPASTFSQQLQYNFFKCFAEDTSYVRPGTLPYTIREPHAMPNKPMYGSGSLISQMLSNIKKAFEIVLLPYQYDTATHTAQFVYTIRNTFKIKNGLNATLMDMPVDLRVLASCEYTYDTPDNFVKNIIRVDMVLYIGPYVLQSTPLDPMVVSDYTKFGSTAPHYCCTYHYEFESSYDHRPPVQAGEDGLKYPIKVIDSAETFKVVRDVPWESDQLDDVHLSDNNTACILEYHTGSEFDPAWEILQHGIYQGDWIRESTSTKNIWANQFGWIYSIIMFRNTYGMPTDRVGDNTDTNKAMCPFVNFVSTQQSYKSSQYVLDIQRGTWAQWTDINMMTGIEHENEFYFIRNADRDETISDVLFSPIQTQLCRFNSDMDGDFGVKPIDAHYKTGFTDLGAPNLKKFTKCKIFGTASVFWGRYPYDLYYSIDFQEQDPVRYSGETIEPSLRKPKILSVKPKMAMKSKLNNVSYSEYAAHAKYLSDYLSASSNVKWVNMMTVATQGTRIALGSRFAITEHNVIVWGYQIHYIPLSSY